MRMVGVLRILRTYWSRTTPRPWAAWPASTSSTGEGPSEGATMAPEICSASSGWGARLRLEKPNRHATLQSRADLARRYPYPQTTPGPRNPRYPTVRRRPATRACTRPSGLRRWVRCAPTSSSGEAPSSTGRGRPGSPADVAVTGGPDQRHRRRPRRATRVLDAVGPGREPRLHRHPHPLRRPGVLGPRPHAVLVPRRDDGDRRQLRVLHRPHPRRRRRAPGAHAPARRGHELRHPGRRRALGRVRDVPAVPRRGRRRGARRSTTAATSATPRCGSTSWARTPTSAPATADEIAPHAGGGGRRHGGRRGGLRLERVADPQRRQRPAGALAGGRPGRAARPARAASSSAGAASWRCSRAASSPTRRCSGSSARSGARSPGRRC